jgi:hypothetical protein
VKSKVSRPGLTSHAVILTNSDLLEIQISWFVDCEYYEITTFRVLPRWRFQISRVSTISGNDSSLIASA